MQILQITDTGKAFQINPGLNDAWYNPDTVGQGFLIMVYPDVMQMFLAWFTYEIERPDDMVPEMLGEAGHRWLTAQGAFSGNQALLDIYVARGGVFDISPPIPQQEQDGTMLIEFTGCDKGTVSYEIPSINRSGVVPIQRLVSDNLALCEALNGESDDK